MVLFINGTEIIIRELDSEQSLKEHIAFKFNLVSEFIDFSSVDISDLYIHFMSSLQVNINLVTIHDFLGDDFNIFITKSIKFFETDQKKEWEDNYTRSNNQSLYINLINYWIYNNKQNNITSTNITIERMFGKKSIQQCQDDYNEFIEGRKQQFETDSCVKFSNKQIESFEKLTMSDIEILSKIDNNIIVRLDLPVLVNIPSLIYIFNMLKVNKNIPIVFYNNYSKCFYNTENNDFLYNLTYDDNDKFKFLENMISENNIMFTLYQGKDDSNINKKVYYSICSCRINEVTGNLEFILYIYFNEKEYSPVVPKTIQNYFNMNYSKINELNIEELKNKSVYNDKINNFLKGLDENLINKVDYNTFICNQRSEFIIPNLSFDENLLLYILYTNEYFYKIFSTYEFEQLERTKGNRKKIDKLDTKNCLNNIQINYYDPLFKQKIKFTLHSCIRKLNDQKLKDISHEKIPINDYYTIIQIHNCNSTYILNKLLSILKKLFNVYTQNIKSNDLTKFDIKYISKPPEPSKVKDKELQFLKEIAPEIFKTQYPLSTLCQKKDGLSRIPTIYNKDSFDKIYNEYDLVSSLKFEEIDSTYNILFYKVNSNDYILKELNIPQDLIDNIDKLIKSSDNIDKFNSAVDKLLKNNSIDENIIQQVIDKMNLQMKYLLFKTKTHGEIIGYITEKSKTNKFQIKPIGGKNIDIKKDEIIEIENLVILLEYKNYYFKCKNKPFLFPYLTLFRDAHKFKIPCCSDNVVSLIPTESITVSTRILSTNKKLKYTHPNPQKAYIPKNIKELLNITYSIGQGDEFFRRASFINSNSFLFCVLYAMDKNGFKKLADDGSKIQECNQIMKEYRASLIENITLLNITKQQNYNMSIDDIVNYIDNNDKYFDPKMFIKLIEHIENTNIFLFTTNELNHSDENYKDGCISFPYYTKGYYNQNINYENTIIIFEHNGADNKAFVLPQCELIYLHNVSNFDIFNFNKHLIFTRSLQQFYKDNNEFFINGDKVINYTFDNSNISSQYIDSFGKIRLIKLSNDIILETSPMEPLPIINNELLIDEYVSQKFDNASVNYLISRLNFKLKHIILEDDKIVSIVFNLENNYQEFTLKLDSIKKSEFKEYKHIFAVKYSIKKFIEETVDINNYNLYKKLANYTIEYAYYMFSKFLNEKNIDINNLLINYQQLIEEYFDNEIVLRDDYNISDVGNISFYFENEFNITFFLNLNNYLIIYGNKDTIIRIKYLINLMIIQQPDLLINYHTFKIMNNYYRDISDFKHSEDTIISRSLTNLITCINNTINFDNYNLNYAINLMNSSNLDFYKPYPFYYKHIDSEGFLHHNMYLMQNIADSEEADTFDNIELATSNSKLYNTEGINYGEDTQQVKVGNYNILFYNNDGNLQKIGDYDNNIYLYELKSKNIVVGSMIEL